MQCCDLTTNAGNDFAAATLAEKFKALAIADLDSIDNGKVEADFVETSIDLGRWQRPGMHALTPRHCNFLLGQHDLRILPQCQCDGLLLGKFTLRPGHDGQQQ